MLPAEFESRMKILLGDTFQSFIEECSKPPVKAISINTLYDVSFLPLPDLKKIPYAAGAYYIDESFPEKPGRTPLHHAGAYYIQEPSAMAPLSSLEIKDGIKILDMCASPGGKTVQAAMKNRSGVIVANEIDRQRAMTLVQNIERMGIKNCIVTSLESSAIAMRYPDFFDLVVCDAPCPGEGMMRKNSLAISMWNTGNIKMCAARQRKILNNAALTVRHGGNLIYSTCTFSLEENEMTIDSFLETHPDFKLRAVPEVLRQASLDGICFDGCKSKDLDKCRRFYPHISPGEGQFFALMQRDDDEQGEFLPHGAALQELSPSELKIVSDFFDSSLESAPIGVKKFLESAVISPDFPLPDTGVLLAGVRIGQISKGRIIPHHQFFSAYGRLFLRQKGLDKEEAKRYISGQTLDADIKDGWGAALFCGIPLGGFKAVSGCLKNHYPKGLRQSG